MKKFISLFLVFFLLALSGNLYAKKQGAKLIITKKDGYQTAGELITVKPNSLLLLDAGGKDFSVDIKDIKIIKIIKKSKAVIGVLVGGSIGALIGLAASKESESWWFLAHEQILYPLAGVTVGALIGLVLGEVAGKDKTIHIEGMTDSEIQKTFDKLRKKARIRDYK